MRQIKNITETILGLLLAMWLQRLGGNNTRGVFTSKVPQEPQHGDDLMHLPLPGNQRASRDATRHRHQSVPLQGLLSALFPASLQKSLPCSWGGAPHGSQLFVHHSSAGRTGALSLCTSLLSALALCPHKASGESPPEISDNGISLSVL